MSAVGCLFASSAPSSRPSSDIEPTTPILALLALVSAQIMPVTQIMLVSWIARKPLRTQRTASRSPSGRPLLKDRRASVESAASYGVGQVREHAEEFARVAILGQASGGHINCRLDDRHDATFERIIRQGDLQQNGCRHRIQTCSQPRQTCARVVVDRPRRRERGKEPGAEFIRVPLHKVAFDFADCYQCRSSKRKAPFFWMPASQAYRYPITSGATFRISTENGGVQRLQGWCGSIGQLGIVRCESHEATRWILGSQMPQDWVNPSGITFPAHPCLQSSAAANDRK